MIILDFSITYFSRTESFFRPESFIPSKKHFIDPFTQKSITFFGPCNRYPVMYQNSHSEFSLQLPMTIPARPHPKPTILGNFEGCLAENIIHLCFQRPEIDGYVSRRINPKTILLVFFHQT